MANLTSAINYALSGLSVSTVQSAVTSRNVSSAGDDNYSRRVAEVITLPNGVANATQIIRRTDRQLLDKLLSTNSEASARQVTVDALDRINSLTGDPQEEQSIAAGLGKLQEALRSYGQNPSSPTLARATFEAARDVSQRLNKASTELSTIRTEADKAMAESADRVNNLLNQFKVVNDAIVRGQGTANDLSDDLDQRDAILKHLSDEIGIRTTTRTNNDVLIYAAGGAVLFEGSPRPVAFTTSGLLTAGQAGAALSIDGAQVTGRTASMPVSGGKLAAYAAIRDELGPDVEQQLDLLASGLIRVFSETDPQMPSMLPAAEGLFRGDGVVPSGASATAGLASLITANPLADPDSGGSLLLIRDGGFGGAGYLRNTESKPGYQTRLEELADAIDATQSFSAKNGLGGSISVKTFSLQSASWISAQRRDSQAALDLADSTRSRAANALAQANGVNIDHEMATLLDLEKSYQASAKVLTVINSMLGTLFEAVSR